MPPAALISSTTLSAARLAPPPFISPPRSFTETDILELISIFKTQLAINCAEIACIYIFKYAEYICIPTEQNHNHKHPIRARNN